MYYASCIFVISLVSIIISLVEIRRQNQALHDMVSSSNNTKVNVIRKANLGSNESLSGYDTDGHRLQDDKQINSEEIRSTELVPGDVINIEVWRSGVSLQVLVFRIEVPLFRTFSGLLIIKMI